MRAAPWRQQRFLLLTVPVTFSPVRWAPCLKQHSGAPARAGPHSGPNYTSMGRGGPSRPELPKSF